MTRAEQLKQTHEAMSDADHRLLERPKSKNSTYVNFLVGYRHTLLHENNENEELMLSRVISRDANNSAMAAYRNLSIEEKQPYIDLGQKVLKLRREKRKQHLLSLFQSISNSMRPSLEPANNVGMREEDSTDGKIAATIPTKQTIEERHECLIDDMFVFPSMFRIYCQHRIEERYGSWDRVEDLEPFMMQLDDEWKEGMMRMVMQSKVADTDLERFGSDIDRTY
jgi:hypothetical protein